MSSVSTCLQELMKIEGSLGAVVIDLKTSRVLGLLGDSPTLDVDAAMMTDMLKARLRILQSFDRTEQIDDVVFTQTRQYHLLRCVGGAHGSLVYLTLNRQRANLALARVKLARLDSELVV